MKDEDMRNWIILGNIRLKANALREFLKKSHYWVRYDRKTAKMELTANHGNGGVQIFEADNVPFETAKRFAEELGLEKESGDGWYKWNPIVFLGFDGSADAIELTREILELGLPLTEYRCEGHWEVYGVGGQGKYCSPMWSKEEVSKIIKEAAKRYEDSLSTTP